MSLQEEHDDAPTEEQHDDADEYLCEVGLVGVDCGGCGRAVIAAGLVHVTSCGACWCWMVLLG